MFVNVTTANSICQYLCKIVLILYKSNYFYTALKDPDETYLLNGEFMITMFPKKIEYHGISMDYSGSNSVTEYVNSSQILPKDLFLQVANLISFILII